MGLPPRLLGVIATVYRVRKHLREEKTSVRMVLGVASLPLGMPVELEVMLEVVE
jgi:enamine deaminase RidA (YjgF/YER057c/UK114 family)